MAVALFLTAAGGLLFATFPSLLMLMVLYGYWGFTTIFLFWAAMIKATRVWGGEKKQGVAFGYLDGGRGLVAAAFGTLGVFIFSLFITTEIEAASLEERQEAFRYVILISSVIIAFIGILILLFLKSSRQEKPEKPVVRISRRQLLSNYRTAIKIPSVWLLMVIVMCAYVGYKLTDDISLYAKEVMLYNEIEAAQTGTFLLYIRPIIGVTIGLLIDRSRASLMMIIGFIVILLGASFFASGLLAPTMTTLFLVAIVITATGIYAFRTLYFAAMKEGAIPLAVTGTAVGLISLIGYTPDIFVGPAMGYLLDNNPGATGHQYVFWMMAIFAFIGLLAAVGFHRFSIKNTENDTKALR